MYDDHITFWIIGVVLALLIIGYLIIKRYIFNQRYIMEQFHRDLILDNIDLLVQHTEYEALKKNCLDQQIIFDEMIEQIEKFDGDSRHHELIKKITHRGPTAFEAFAGILKQHFPLAYEVLNEVSTKECMRPFFILENIF